MTINCERIWSIQRTRSFLLELADSKGYISKKELRERIYRCLRHYPEDWWLNELGKKLEILDGSKV